MINIELGSESNLSQGRLEKEYHSDINKVIEQVNEKYQKGYLGFLDVDKNNEADRILEYVEKNKDNFESVVVLGIGGSALGTRAVLQAIKGKYYNELQKEKRGGYPKLYVLDNIDPREIRDINNIINLDKTLFIVISKSGTTIETMAQYKVFSPMVEAQGLDIRKHFVVVTGENSYLRAESIDNGLEVFDIPEGIGGRYSVFTPVGLLPLAFAGIDIKKLLLGVENTKQNVLSRNIAKNKALLTAIVQYHSYTKFENNISVFFPYIGDAKPLGEWYGQLVGESLGKKEDIGITLGCSLGTTDQHSQLQLYSEGPKDKLIIFLELNNFGTDYAVSPDGTLKLSRLMNLEKYGTQQSIDGDGRLTYTIKLDQLDEEALGELMTLIQAQTVMLGELFAVNPFNQPGVEKGKIITKEMLGEHKDVFLTFFEKQSGQEKEQKEKKHETIFISP